MRLAMAVAGGVESLSSNAPHQGKPQRNCMARLSRPGWISIRVEWSVFKVGGGAGEPPSRSSLPSLPPALAR